MSADLAAFLIERIDEDERRARAAAGRIPLIYDDAVLRDRGIGIAQAGFIAHWPPARVLAECEAKRRIVDLAVAARSVAERAKEMGWPSDIHQSAAVAYEDALALLALPFAGHPDFDPEWRLT